LAEIHTMGLEYSTVLCVTVSFTISSFIVEVGSAAYVCTGNVNWPVIVSV